MMSETYTSITDALTDLHGKMSKDGHILWPEDFIHAYQFNKTGQELLNKKAATESTKHMLWNDAYMQVNMMNTFDALFWIKSFEHLGAVFGVPISWMAALQLVASASTPTSGKWGLKPLPTFIDEEGYCNESLWAAHLDGVEAGRITNDVFPFARNPNAESFTDDALAKATEKAESMDMSVDDYLAELSDDSLDMMNPTRGDDE
tara:strand:+ start:50 stop:661 length:612 start_codon:yes stop_codon:yes gene_type:complete